MWGLLLLATDGSPPALEATRKAIALARLSSAPLVAVAVGFPDERAPERAGLHYAKELAERQGVVCTVEAREGVVADEILLAASEHHAGLLVLGDTGRTGLTRLLMGSVAQAVLERSPVPVLVVRGETSENQASVPTAAEAETSEGGARTTMVELDHVVGAVGHAAAVVSADNTAVALGSGALPIFGTPALLALVEKAAVQALQGHLPLGMTTLGTGIQLRHMSATPLGHNVQAEATLVAVSGRRLEFRVAAFDERERIAEGTHERFIVDAGRFMDRMTAKRPKGS